MQYKFTPTQRGANPNLTIEQNGLLIGHYEGNSSNVYLLRSLSLEDLALLVEELYNYTHEKEYFNG